MTAAGTPPTAELRGLEAAAQVALESLRADYLDRYGAVLFDVTVTAVAADASLRLDGRVLLPGQRQAAVAAVREATGTEVVDRIDVLTEREASDGWFLPAGPVVDILRQPGGDLSTQVVPGDPALRWLGAHDDWWVLELADGTLGWVRPPDVKPLTTGAPASVAAWRAAWRGVAQAASEAEWREALAAWWGSPYRWGGATQAGVDCSGLTQRLYKQVLGVGLPKHSSDQLKQGERASLAALATGDLLVLKHRERALGHVAIVLSAEPARVAHASHERGVREEPLADLLERYQLRGVRRFV